MSSVKIIFFGSFLQYSSYVLQGLLDSHWFEIQGVVTTPPTLDKKGEHKNPVHLLAETQQLPVFTPDTLTNETLADLLTATGQVDLFVTAGYGKLLPTAWLVAPKIAALNLHFSLLPAYRGANPAEWSILRGETTSGVTLIEMSPSFDTGKMIAQSGITLAPTATRESVYEELYRLGQQVLPQMIKTYVEYRDKQEKEGIKATELQELVENDTKLHFFLPPQQQVSSNLFYARRLTRQDGFIAWKTVQKLQNGQSIDVTDWPLLDLVQVSVEPVGLVERATRALADFPSLWTEVPTSKGLTRMKILSVSSIGSKLILDTVHLAGKAPSTWNEIKNGIITI